MDGQPKATLLSRERGIPQVSIGSGRERKRADTRREDFEQSREEDSTLDHAYLAPFHDLVDAFWGKHGQSASGSELKSGLVNDSASSQNKILLPLQLLIHDQSKGNMSMNRC